MPEREGNDVDSAPVPEPVVLEGVRLTEDRSDTPLALKFNGQCQDEHKEGNGSAIVGKEGVERKRSTGVSCLKITQTLALYLGFLTIVSCT